MSNFNTKNKSGKIAEKLFEEIKLKHCKNIKYEDVSGIKNYQNIDVDYVVTTLKDNKEHLFEVKGDWIIWKTGFLFAETRHEYIDSTYVKEGWFLLCKCDWLVYIDLEYGKMYILDFDLVKKYADTHKLIEKQTGNKNRDSNKLTYGWLIPMDDLLEWIEATGKKAHVEDIKDYDTKLKEIKDEYCLW